jgi:hypothetical protein
MTNTEKLGAELFDKVCMTILKDEEFKDPAAYDIAAAVQDAYFKAKLKYGTKSPRPACEGIEKPLDWEVGV